MTKHKNEKLMGKANYLVETFGNNFWNGVCFQCLFSTEFLKKVIQIIPLEVYRSKERKIIMKMLYDYYNQYKAAPKELFYDLFQEAEKELSDKDYDRCMALIGILKGFTGKNYQYYLDRLNDSLKHYYLEEGAVEFASLIKAKKYDEAKAVILKAMKSTEETGQSDYFDYFKDTTYIEQRLAENKYKMKTLIKGLDNIIGGFNPPWLITILGTPKQGKSFWLLELTVAALFQGLNVLFVSLEMDKKVVEDRLDQIIGFMSVNESDDAQEVMQYKREQWVKGAESVKSIYDINSVDKNRKRFRRIGGGNLKVVAHHRGRMNYMDVDRILDEAEEKDGFVADVLVVDYLGIMRETAAQQSKKDRISENCLGIKEICGKRHLIGITAMQGNRKAMQAKVFQPHMIADDIDCIHHTDIAMSLCSTKREEAENKYRLYGAINRHGPQNWSLGLVRSLSIGQIAIGEYKILDEDNDEEAEEQRAKAAGYY